MEPQSLDGHMGREIEIDLCQPCQSIWLDARENLQLTPGATLTMFRIIGEHVSRPSLEDRDIAKCTRCNAQLRRTQDMQRNTRFEYFRCPNHHGRLTTFFEFLKEKDFRDFPSSPCPADTAARRCRCSTCSRLAG